MYDLVTYLVGRLTRRLHCLLEGEAKKNVGEYLFARQLAIQSTFNRAVSISRWRKALLDAELSLKVQIAWEARRE